MEDTLRCLVPTSSDRPPTGEGKLSGVKFVVKDLMGVSGHISSFGLARWRQTHGAAKQTAPLVAKLLSAGGHLVGLTKMDQLAYSLIGNAGEGEPPTNPIYSDRFTGGSSSGSASAVAGGMAEIGIGTDTAGSIRVPAAACGVFSIRPTHGNIDNTGVITLAQSFDVVGLFGRTAKSLERGFEVLYSGQRSSDVQIAEVLLPEDVLSSFEPRIARIFELTAVSIAQSIGAKIKRVNFASFIQPSIADILARLQGREIWSNHGEWVEANSDCLTEDVRIRLDRCRQLSMDSVADKTSDAEQKKNYSSELSDLITNDKVLILPVMPDLPPLLSATQETLKSFRLQTFRFVAPASLSGFPQMVIPAIHDDPDLVVGVGLLGARNTDFSLLAIVATAANNELRFTV